MPACIDSILSQDYPDWQCVFVDGYSTDGSWEYMQQFAADRRFLLLRGLRQGMYADWNECLRYIETDYFYFLTSDDTCSSELASTAIAALDAYPTVDACHFKFDLINETGAIVLSHQALVDKAFSLYSEVNHTTHLRSGLSEFMMHFVYRALYQTITSLVFRCRVIEKLGEFPSNYGAIGDYDWTMRLGLYTNILFIPKLLATWRVYTGQATEDAMMPHITENLLAIAQKNLELLRLTGKDRAFKHPPDDREILADLHNEHACSLYRAIAASKSPAQTLKYLSSLVKNYPLYPIKKLLNRISRNQLYPYPGRTSFARQIIKNYGLDWMTPIEIPQLKFH